MWGYVPMSYMDCAVAYTYQEFVGQMNEPVEHLKT